MTSGISYISNAEGVKIATPSTVLNLSNCHKMAIVICFQHKESWVGWNMKKHENPTNIDIMFHFVINFYPFKDNTMAV